LAVVITGHVPLAAHDRSIDVFAYVLTVVAGGVLAFWRRSPQLVYGVVAVALGCYVGRHYPSGPLFAFGLFALFALSVRADRRTGLIGAVVLGVVLGVAGAVASGAMTVLPFFYLGWSAAAVFLGDALRNRRSYLRELEERARYLELTREQEARRQVAEDRLRVARDLHDSVAHAMATINVQAGAAAHVVDRRPEVAKEAFAAIRRASGEVLDELAAMLTLLRDDGETAERAPTPGIDEISQLVAATRDAGVPVSLVLDGPTQLVPRPVGIAAYRIVQESLTNVIRHAGAQSARVTVRAGDDRGLVVEVCDDGFGPRASIGAGSGTGTGIRGMRERAESTGGRLEAGPGAQGGFTVRAEWDGRP
jgi:signal transduction histidine kinase